MSYDVERDSRFARAEVALEEFFGRVDSGEQISFEAWTSKHAEIADELRQLHSVCEPLRAREAGLSKGGAQGGVGSTPSILELNPQLGGPNHFADYEVNPQPIAEGGMGTILSVRDRALRRELAMKVLRAPESRADQRIVARFLDEARITSQLDHPGIVPVHEMGMDAAGRPYFTMKRVQGQTFERILERVVAGDAEWTQARALGVLQRVCEAVAFAHKRGVIHRDLKPSNVMVGDFGEVYVMDWGLARVLEGNGGFAESEIESARHGAAREPEDDSKLSTQHGDVLGTPAYMAPEQAMGKHDQVGRHSDAYAIGAMLYQLLAGRPPYSDDRGAPSSRVVLARVLAGPPKPLHLLVRNAPVELIAICERAMERDPSRRYSDVAAMSEDLSAFLEGRVVRAHETGAWAEARKWVRRNRLLATSLSAALLILIGGIATTTSQYLRADEKAAEALANLGQAVLQKARAEENAQTAQEQKSAAEAARTFADQQKEQAQAREAETQLVADFGTKLLENLSVDQFGHTLVAQLRSEVEDAQKRLGRHPEDLPEILASFDRAVEFANTTSVAQRVLETTIFEPAVATIEKEYSDKPLLQATLQTPLARTLRKLGLYGLGERASRAAVNTRRRILGNDHPDTLRSINDLAILLLDQGKLSEAEPLCRETLAARRAKLGNDDSATLQSINNLAGVLQNQGKLNEAEPLLFEVVAARRAKLGDHHAETLGSINNLAALLLALGKPSESEPLFREALAGLRAKLGDNHASTLASMNNLGFLLQLQGRLSEAEPFLREALAGRRATLGDDHPDTLGAINNLALLLLDQGKLSEAEPLFREALAGLHAKLGDDHPKTISAMSNLGMLLRIAGRLIEAEPLMRVSLAGARAKLGNDHPDTLTGINNLAVLLHDLGREDEAERLYRESLTGSRAKLGDTHPDTLTSINNLGTCLRNQGKLSEAEPLLHAALEHRRLILGDDHPDTISSIGNYGLLLQNQGKLGEAELLLREASERSQRVLGNDHPNSLTALVNLGELLQTQGKRSEAEPLLRNALEGRRRILGDQHLDTLHSVAGLGALLVETGELEEAKKLLLDCESACLRVGETGLATLKATRSFVVKLYDSMEKAWPGQGHGAKADEYRVLIGDATKPLK